MKIHFARYCFDKDILYKIKELKAKYPGFHLINVDGKYRWELPPTKEDKGNFWLAWIKWKSLNASKTFHSEKIRLNRYNRRKCRYLLHKDPEMEMEMDLRPVRINPRDIE